MQLVGMISSSSRIALMRDDFPVPVLPMIAIIVGFWTDSCLKFSATSQHETSNGKRCSIGYLDDECSQTDIFYPVLKRKITPGAGC